MKKITKIQQYAILYLNTLGYESDNISKELKIEQDKVLEVLKNLTTKNNQAQNLMITKTVTKKNNVAVMTKEASEISDAMRHKAQNTARHTDNIFRPRSR